MKNGIYIEAGSTCNFRNVKKAAALANEILRDTDFYMYIAAHTGFDYADVPPATIATLMRNTLLTMTIDLYYSINPVRNFDGFDDVEHPNVIHLNVWKTDRSPESMCNTIIHACVHAVNACNTHYTFGHGDNVLQGKENTAPYWIGALAQKMVSEDDTFIIPLEHDVFEPRLLSIRQQFSKRQFMWA